MKLVIVESPFAPKGRYGTSSDDMRCELEENIRYARMCIRYCLTRGEAPFASHLLYTQEGVLDDFNLDERKLGIAAGLEWVSKAELSVVYDDMGVSHGMAYGAKQAQLCGIPIEYRKLPNWDGWKIPTPASAPIVEPVPQCDDCLAPALHIEGFHGTTRKWCENHVPMSGHYESCRERCWELREEVSQRLYGKPWSALSVETSPSWPRTFGEPGGHTKKQKDFAVALDTVLKDVAEVVNCSLGRNSTGHVWVVTVNENGSVYSVQCQLEEGTDPCSTQALREVNRRFRSYLRSRGG